MTISIDRSVKEIPYYPKAMMYGSDEGWVRLSSNENPFPPSPDVLSSILDQVFSVNRYPGGELELKEAIGRKFHVGADQVVIGNGSNELIEMVLKGMKDQKRKKVIVCDPSFAFYTIAAKIYGYEIETVPLADMHVDLRSVGDRIDGDTRVVFLNNPLNPTGTIFGTAEFLEFLERLGDDVIVVVDEAYVEFVENPRFPKTIGLIDRYPIVVLKTFSKAYGLAGLRVGYGIGSTALVSFMERTKQPFSINAVALAAARKALEDDSYLQMVLANNRKVRTFFNKALEDLSLEFVPTEANFVLIRLGASAEAITRRMFDEKILVRWMGAYGLADYIRVTYGRLEENTIVLNALKRLIGEEKGHHHR